MDYAIETTDLTKCFGSLTTVNKVNLNVEKSTIHGFLGPNGAGKTTTIKMVVGLLRPTSGSVKVLGQEVHVDDADSRLNIGYMSELPKSLNISKARNFLIFTLHVRDVEARKGRSNSQANRFGWFKRKRK